MPSFRVYVVVVVTEGTEYRLIRRVFVMVTSMVTRYAKTESKMKVN